MKLTVYTSFLTAMMLTKAALGWKGDSWDNDWKGSYHGSKHKPSHSSWKDNDYHHGNWWNDWNSSYKWNGGKKKDYVRRDKNNHGE